MLSVFKNNINEGKFLSVVKKSSYPGPSESDFGLIMYINFNAHFVYQHDDENNARDFSVRALLVTQFELLFYVYPNRSICMTDKGRVFPHAVHFQREHFGDLQEVVL